jgi:putative PIN family toxin of toxin-antitoxin system
VGYVFDTNVIVSALLLPDSVPSAAFHHAMETGGILVSESLLVELQSVLQRQKFDRYLARDKRDAFLERLVEEATLVETTEVIDACRDPRDNMLLELAVAGRAKCIVTGDADLLILSPFREIPIVTPQDFLQE